MAAFTPNSGGTVNWDTLAGGSVNATLDTCSISNQTTLVIDTDSYLCANHSAAAGSVDTVSFAGTGGKLKLDGKNVRVIPYNTGTGNVPAIGTTISQGAVSAYFLGVWANWQSEPTASGSAMPASGFIKVRAVTGGAFASGAITGIGASATGADVVGWIEVRGADTGSITVPRLGTFEVDGDWFELGTTNGSRGQVLACPTTATVAGVFPGVQIETASGSGVYEWFTCVGSLAAASTIPTDATRGKIVWQTTSGIRIGSDGTNNVGYLPPTGCKVRIPNVIMTCCTRTAGSGSGPRVLPNATLGTRQEFVTTSSGTITVSKGVMHWYAIFSQPFQVVLADSSFADTISISECASPIDTKRVLVAPTQAQLNYAYSLQSSSAGGTVEDCFFVRYSLASSSTYCVITNYCTGIGFTRNKVQTLTNKANASTAVWAATGCVDCTWTDPKHIGGRMVQLTCVRSLVTGAFTYCENFSGTTGTTYSHHLTEFTTGSASCTFNANPSFPETNNHPYGGIVYFGASYNCLVYGTATFASPLSLGVTNPAGVFVGSSGNNAGHRVKRCYVSATRTNFSGFVNSDTDCIIENCSGDYADVEYLVALNSPRKGNGATPGATGQTAVYGSHWFDAFTAATTGRVVISCNEPTAASAAQCAVTGGTAYFNSAGQVSLRALNDQVTWTMPYFAKGHTAFQNVAPTLTGTNTANLTYEYQIDTGGGWSAWKTLNATNLSAETISPSSGFKLKVRATCNTANTGNLLTYIRIDTSTTSAAQSENNYTLLPATLTLTGLVSGSDIVLLSPGTSTELSNTDAHPSTSFSWEYDAVAVTGADVCVYKAGYVPFIVRNLPLTSAGASLPIQQVADRNYTP